jgi:tetratricopeptide (TPR) repeat protein
MTDANEKNEPAAAQSLLETLRAGYDADPQSRQGAALLAEHYADLGWYNESLDVYRAALKIHHDDFFLHLGYGNTCYQHHDLEEALRAFRTLTELKPERIEGWNNTGIVLMSLERVEEAKGAFERVLAIEPDNAGALLNLGNYFAGKGDGPSAIGLFERAIETRPDFADAWFNLGNTHLAAKDHVKAQKAFERAIRLRREFVSAHKNLGYIHELSGSWDKAIESYGAAAQLDRADATLHINLANAYLALDRFDEAKSCFLKAVRLAPKNTAGWLGLRHISLLKGDIPTYLRSTNAILPHLDGPIIAKTVGILLELHHRPEALEVINSADNCNKEGDELDAQRLLVYRLENINAGKRTALYKRLSGLPSLSDTVLRALGRYAMENGDFEQALNHLEKIRAQETAAEYLKIACLIALGRTDAAREKTASAIEQWPANGAFRFCEARLRCRGGDLESARASLIQALDSGFYAIDDIKMDPEMAHLFATLAASRPEPDGGQRSAA